MHHYKRKCFQDFLFTFHSARGVRKIFVFLYLVFSVPNTSYANPQRMAKGGHKRADLKSPENTLIIKSDVLQAFIRHVVPCVAHESEPFLGKGMRRSTFQ